MSGYNVPDDWGAYWRRCERGHRYHASDGGCGVCDRMIGVNGYLAELGAAIACDDDDCDEAVIDLADGIELAVDAPTENHFGSLGLHVDGRLLGIYTGLSPVTDALRRHGAGHPDAADRCAEAAAMLLGKEALR